MKTIPNITVTVRCTACAHEQQVTSATAYSDESGDRYVFGSAYSHCDVCDEFAAPVESTLPTPINFMAACDEMERSGGSFAQAIGEAYTRADADNKLRLRKAFGDLFTRYSKLAASRKAEEAS